MQLCIQTPLEEIIQPSGSYALNKNTTGEYNYSHGFICLKQKHYWSFNSANGYASLYSNTTGNISIVASGYICFKQKYILGSSYNTATGQTLLSQKYNWVVNNSANGYAALTIQILQVATIHAKWLCSLTIHTVT